MKSIGKFIVWIFLAILCISCDEKDPIESKTTFFPVVKNVLLEVGDSFSFSDVKILENAKEIEFDELDTTVNVDTSKSGAYSIDYSATNVDGFSRSGSALVSVVEDVNQIKAIDISGNYFDAFAPDVNVEVTKIQDGFFEISDVFVPEGISVVAMVLSDGEIAIAEQQSIFGSVVANTTEDAETYGFYDDTVIELGIKIGGEFYEIFLDKKP